MVATAVDVVDMQDEVIRVDVVDTEPVGAMAEITVDMVPGAVGIIMQDEGTRICHKEPDME